MKAEVNTERDSVLEQGFGLKDVALLLILALLLLPPVASWYARLDKDVAIRRAQAYFEAEYSAVAKDPKFETGLRSMQGNGKAHVVVEAVSPDEKHNLLLEISCSAYKDIPDEDANCTTRKYRWYASL